MVIEMKVEKIKKEEVKEEVNSAEEYSLAKMGKIIVVLLVLFALFYFITSIIIKKQAYLVLVFLFKLLKLAVFCVFLIGY